MRQKTPPLIICLHCTLHTLLIAGVHTIDFTRAINNIVYLQLENLKSSSAQVSKTLDFWAEYYSILLYWIHVFESRLKTRCHEYFKVSHFECDTFLQGTHFFSSSSSSKFHMGMIMLTPLALVSAATHWHESNWTWQ